MSYSIDRIMDKKELLKKYKREWIRKKRASLPKSPRRRAQTLSENHKRHIADSMKKYKRTKEHNKNLSSALLGKKLSSEHVRALSEAQKRRGTIPPSQRGRIPWNYRGATKLQAHIRKLYEYRQWRSDVFTRDNFTCKNCKQKGGRLNADHIKEFAKILQEYNILTVKEALACAELWNINNGRTLCIPCHKNRKRWEGK